MCLQNQANRIARLERRVRYLSMILALTLVPLVVLLVSAWSLRPDSEVLRGRALVIVDNQGRERIVMGAPVPEPDGQRIAPTTGLVIRDTAGAERFGVGLFPNGRMVMGFDAPPGTGDDRNRERITISTGPTGGAELRFLDRHTKVRAHMSLFQDDNVYLFMTDDQPDRTIVHRIGATGDTVIVHPK